MTESAAILIHLGLSYPSSSLLPTGPSARAQAVRGLVFIAANCYAALSINDYPARWTTATTASAQDKVRQGARRQLHKNRGIFADTFAATPYLQQHRPAFAELLGRIESHDSVAPVFRQHWLAP